MTRGGYRSKSPSCKWRWAVVRTPRHRRQASGSVVRCAMCTTQDLSLTIFACAIQVMSSSISVCLRKMVCCTLSTFFSEYGIRRSFVILDIFVLFSNAYWAIMAMILVFYIWEAFRSVEAELSYLLELWQSYYPHVGRLQLWLKRVM